MICYIAKESVIRGDVSLGENASVWYNATLRGDLASITIGDRTNIQDNVVVHVDIGHPVVIGNDVTVGHGAILHGCTIGDTTLIGMGAIIMDGVTIGAGSIIGAGALVTQNKQIPDGSMVYGNPARIIRPVRSDERDSIWYSAAAYVEEARAQLSRQSLSSKSRRKEEDFPGPGPKQS